MNCNTYMPNGNVQTECPLSEVNKVYICDPAVSFSSYTDVYNLATWKAKIYTALTMYIPSGLTSYEVTTDDPNVLTTAFGQKFVTNEPAPSAVIYLNSNWCDYVELLGSLNGGYYGVIYELKNGQIFLQKKTDGTFVPFAARLTAINKGIPLAGDVANNFPVHIHHKSYDEFRKGALISPMWDLSELALAMPAGLNMSVYTAFDADDVVVYISDRCGDALTGLLVANFEVLRSNFLDTPAITAAVDGDDGTYTLTLQKGSVPASLAAGDSIKFRVNKITDSVTSYLSNPLTITGDGSS